MLDLSDCAIDFLLHHFPKGGQCPLSHSFTAAGIMELLNAGLIEEFNNKSLRLTSTGYAYLALIGNPST
jgi:hypothetical protein